MAGLEMKKLLSIDSEGRLEMREMFKKYVIILGVFIMVMLCAKQLTFAASDKPAPFGRDDLKVYYGKTLIDFPNETKKEFVKRMKGGTWEPDATDANGKPISFNVYKWKGGYAYFKDGILDDLMMVSGAKSFRGVNIGMKESEMLKYYPKAETSYQIQYSMLYIHSFTCDDSDWNLVIGVNTKTKKVEEISIRPQTE